LQPILFESVESQILRERRVRRTQTGRGKGGRGQIPQSFFLFLLRNVNGVSLIQSSRSDGQRGAGTARLINLGWMKEIEE
jgi:hypothetical protein